MKARALRPGWRRLALAAVLLPGGLALAPAPAVAAWDPAEVERTVTFGLEAIAERSLEPVGLPALAIEAMRGLAEIDPGLAVVEAQGRVRIATADRPVAEFPAPPADDSERWGRLVVAAAVAAAEVSAPLRGADAERLYRALFDAALAKADLFSRYAGAAEARDHRAARNGFGGIGIRFELAEGEARIVEVVEDGPAARAGVRTGEAIVAIDGQPVHGLGREQISARLRGPVATPLLLSVRPGPGARDRAPHPVTLRRSLIVPRSVTFTLDGAVAVARITSFNQRTATTLETFLREARARPEPLRGLVLDLRGNPGGLLDKAVAVADLFVAGGTIVSTRGRAPAANSVLSAEPGDVAEDLPVAVLIDGRSASAAEIVAAALQDAGRGLVIGTASYGKGTVQTVIRLPNDGEITLTWSRFHAPSGYALHGLGVLPAICTAGGLDPAAADPLARPEAQVRLAQTLARWRAVPLGDAAGRQRLRDGCLPAPAPVAAAGTAAEVALAERLLLDRAAYDRGIAASAHVALTGADRAAERRAPR